MNSPGFTTGINPAGELEFNFHRDERRGLLPTPVALLKTLFCHLYEKLLHHHQIAKLPRPMQSPTHRQRKPTVTTQPATSVTVSNATLNGPVNPNGAATTAYFQYGLTTNYDNFSTATVSKA